MTGEADFDTFGHDDAWQLGAALVAACRAEGLPVTIGIHLGAQRVFHAALPGTSADNDDWVQRKTRVVQRFDRASHDVGQIVPDDPDLFHRAFALPRADYAATGGAVPIRVRGTLVGVLAISGLTSQEDHARAAAALAALAGATSSAGVGPPASTAER